MMRSCMVHVWVWLFLQWLCVLGVQQVSNPRIVEHPQDQYVARNEPATLNCKADGEPPPVITWYRNGELVTTSTTNPQSHRMLLPSGQLFFLRIIHNKNQQPDVGTYYCKATNVETGVSVISRNATLAIASLREDFREQPANTHVAVGETATMACQPPKGLPEPSARWKKDGEMVQPGGRLRLDSEGSLIISDARKEDSGVYICIGFNAAGQRESSPARLSVLEKPEFLRMPQDVTVDENNDVVFICQAKGDPEPTIIWKKEEGQIPQGRSQIQIDKSLKIEKVRVSDEGIFICRAENGIGFIEAHVKLSVNAVPSFIVTPRDKTVGVGRRVSFRCEVTGNPPPTVFWNKISKQDLMLPRQDNGRFVISDDGTMTIDPVRREDDGEYQCQALNLAGSAIAKARLEVKELDNRPPPIITYGPQNQTLPLSTVAMMPCAAIGDPPPTVRWLMHGRPVPTTTDPRLAQLDSGTLQISDLKKTDTGVYTCVASSETGETSWTAALKVEAPTDSSVIFKRTPEPATFPGPPTKPLASDITDTLIRLTWKTNPNHGASPVQGYVVEYFSHETGEGWRVAADRIADEHYVVQNLHPGTAYRFLVRAFNSHGLSQPSPVAGPIRTTGLSEAKTKQTADSNVVRRLAGKVLDILPSTVVNSTAIRVHWKLTEEAKQKTREFIEGFHIKYRPTSVQPSVEATETVSDPMATFYLLRNLRKATAYEIRVQPFFGNVEGQDSAPLTAHTLPDVPSAVPHNIHTHMVDNQTMYVSWSPISHEHHNGLLVGYRIYLYDGDGKLATVASVNNTAATSLLIHRVLPNVAYRIQMSAYNSAGEGPRSDLTYVDNRSPADQFQDLLKETWFITALICGAGGVVWIVLCVLGVWLYRCKQRRKKTKLASNGKEQHKGDYNRNSRPGYNYNSLNMPAYMRNNSNAPGGTGGYANVNPMDEVKDNWCNSTEVRSNSSGAYATADHPVAGGGGVVLGGQNTDTSAFQPIHPGRYLLQASSQNRSQQGSGDETVYETGQPEYNHAPGYMSSDSYVAVPGGSSEYSSQDRGGRSVFYLPPPPQHPPPPSEMGTPPHSPAPPPGPHGWHHPPAGPASRQSHPASNHSRSSVRSLACSECEASAYAGLSRCQRCSRPVSPRQPADHHQQQMYHPASATRSPYIGNPDKQQLINEATHQQYAGQRHGSPRRHSPRGGATSEPERTPNVALRAYKLVPVTGGHYSDAEARNMSPGHFRVYLAPGHDPVAVSMATGQAGFDRGSDSQSSHPRSSMATDMSADLPDYGNRVDNAYESDIDGHVRHGNIARWVNDQNEPDACSSVRSSTVISGDEDEDEEAGESYLTAGPDVDFVTAVAAAAHHSGLTVVGSTVTQPGTRHTSGKLSGVNGVSVPSDTSMSSGGGSPHLTSGDNRHQSRVPPPVRAKPAVSSTKPTSPDSTQQQ